MSEEVVNRYITELATVKHQLITSQVEADQLRTENSQLRTALQAATEVKEPDVVEPTEVIDPPAKRGK